MECLIQCYVGRRSSNVLQNREYHYHMLHLFLWPKWHYSISDTYLTFLTFALRLPYAASDSTHCLLCAGPVSVAAVDSPLRHLQEDVHHTTGSDGRAKQNQCNVLCI